jgi:hypothetical protein
MTAHAIRGDVAAWPCDLGGRGRNLQEGAGGSAQRDRQPYLVRYYITTVFLSYF